MADRQINADPRTTLPRDARPADDPGDWITDDDYPPSAVRENLHGTERMRFRVLPTGRVRDCTVVESSGSALLDETGCNVFTLHARYWPARDRTGTAISVVRTQKVRWVLPPS